MATRSLNKMQLIGNLGADPEVRWLPSGSAVCKFTVATSESWTDKNSGELREETEWHRISLWGKLAEIAGQYLHKGDKVYLEGKLKTRKWQDQNGQDRYTTEIHADQMIMLGGKAQGSDTGQGYTRPASTGTPANQAQQSNGRGFTYAPQPQSPPADLPFDDDIPF